MSLPFVKMQAQGNDFVILNGLKQSLPELTENFVRNICERRYGVGCDQLLVLLADDTADARMRIFNQDGSEAANCGNGLRCAADLLMRELGNSSLTIALYDRVIAAKSTSYGIMVTMGTAKVTDTTDAHVDIHIGNEHRVLFETIESMPEDKNIEIVSGQIEDRVWIDIIERGAGRTPACGSGACAVAAAIWHNEGVERPITIEMPGGEVRVSGSMDNLKLEGPVSEVYRGEYQL